MKQRASVLAFLNTSNPPWGEKCISPIQIGVWKDGRNILGLDHPGSAALVEEGRKGEYERVVLTRFSKAGPREVEVRWRNEVDENSKGSGGLASKL